MTNIKISILVSALFFVGVGAYIFAGKPQKRPVEMEQIYSGEVTIRMTRDDFIPDTVTITRGTKVTFVNGDKLSHWPASDLHPSHMLYPEFDPKKGIGPGEEWSFVFEKTGKWDMHDHLIPYIVGTVTVSE